MSLNKGQHWVFWAGLVVLALYVCVEHRPSWVTALIILVVTVALLLKCGDKPQEAGSNPGSDQK